MMEQAWGMCKRVSGHEKNKKAYSFQKSTN